MTTKRRLLTRARRWAGDYRVRIGALFAFYTVIVYMYPVVAAGALVVLAVAFIGTELHWALTVRINPDELTAPVAPPAGVDAADKHQHADPQQGQQEGRVLADWYAEVQDVVDELALILNPEGRVLVVPTEEPTGGMGAKRFSAQESRIYVPAVDRAVPMPLLRAALAHEMAHLTDRWILNKFQPHALISLARDVVAVGVLSVLLFAGVVGFGLTGWAAVGWYAASCAVAVTVALAMSVWEGWSTRRGEHRADLVSYRLFGDATLQMLRYDYMTDRYVMLAARYGWVVDDVQFLDVEHHLSRWQRWTISHPSTEDRVAYVLAHSIYPTA